MVKVAETLRFRLHVEDGDRERLGQVRHDARRIANHAFAMRQLGYSKTDICDQINVQEVAFVKNNAQAVARKACDAYKGYERAHEKWENSDDKAELPEPQPPSTDKWGAFPLVMAHTEGYRLSQRSDDRIGFRISPQPYKKLTGFLRGRRHDLRRVEEILTGDSEWSIGRGEVAYRDGVYYLHVAITTTTTLRDATDAETVIAIDVNERNVAVTALDRETRDTLATLVLDYGQVKAERQRCYDVKRRCQEHDKPSVVDRIGSYVEDYTEWTLHRLSAVVEAYVEWFSNPVVVFEDMTGIRNDIEYGSYMNRRLHKMPFYEFERQVTYKSRRHDTPVISVESRDNSKRCACCGEYGRRQRMRFTCTAESCPLRQDHADRNATVNTAVKGIAKLETDEDSHSAADNYRPRKTPPQTRVRRVGSGRHTSVDVNRPAASCEIASQGVLH